MSDIQQIICIIILFITIMYVFNTENICTYKYKPYKYTKKVNIKYDTKQFSNMENSTKKNKTKQYLLDNILNIEDEYDSENTSPFTNVDIDNFRDTQLMFRENIYNTSHGVDPVDIMNYNTVNNVNNIGKSIAEISSNILGNNL